MSGMRQKIQYSLALELATRVKLRLAAAKGPNHRGEASTPKHGPGTDFMSVSKLNPVEPPGM